MALIGGDCCMMYHFCRAWQALSFSTFESRERTRSWGPGKKLNTYKIIIWCQCHLANLGTVPRSWIDIMDSGSSSESSIEAGNWVRWWSSGGLAASRILICARVGASILYSSESRPWDATWSWPLNATCMYVTNHVSTAFLEAMMPIRNPCPHSLHFSIGWSDNHVLLKYPLTSRSRCADFRFN